jgi:hypothetical protein
MLTNHFQSPALSSFFNFVMNKSLLYEESCLPTFWRNTSPPSSQGRGISQARIQEFSLIHVVQTSSGTHPVSYPVGIGVSFLGVKAAGAWNWPLTNWCRGQENVDLYIHSPIRLRGLVLN